MPEQRHRMCSDFLYGVDAVESLFSMSIRRLGRQFVASRDGEGLYCCRTKGVREHSQTYS